MQSMLFYVFSSACSRKNWYSRKIYTLENCHLFCVIVVTNLFCSTFQVSHTIGQFYRLEYYNSNTRFAHSCEEQIEPDVFISRRHSSFFYLCSRVLARIFQVSSHLSLKSLTATVITMHSFLEHFWFVDVLPTCLLTFSFHQIEIDFLFCFE